MVYFKIFTGMSICGPPSGQYLNYQQEKNATPQELIESNLPLIKYFTRRYPDSIYDDVLSTASMALIIAASKYNGSSRFSSYAGLWIRSLTRREARKYSYGSGGPRRPDRAWTQSSKEYYNNNSKISDKKIPQPIALHLLSPSQVLSSECDTIERVSFFESLYDNLPSTLDDFEKIVFMTRTQPREDFTPDLLPYREVCERLGLDYDENANRVAKGWDRAVKKIRKSSWATENKETWRNVN
ncbi:hypothetical protein TrST_g1819 [Triparma strigata]|uniref:RNA polymerase sigma-70 region 2 domain-containing protein n=1 Tax=Triparma strigata TaxID=1606541 RepID=A0A9W7C557_9STRA|nr:hypothetical protein TrST_g1819 [Triparma strigata]